MMSSEARPWHYWHLLIPREPPPLDRDGRPDHQAMIRQMAEAMGYDLPALTCTPAQVWEGLLCEAERRRGSFLGDGGLQERGGR